MNKLFKEYLTFFYSLFMIPISDGQDFLIKKMDKTPDINYSIRFHLYPGISPVQTMGGGSILLQIEKNKSLIF